MVENGSTDDTTGVALQFARDQVQAGRPVPGRTAAQYAGQGRCGETGHAGRRTANSCLSATPIWPCRSRKSPSFCRPALKRGSFEIAIASREAPGAIRYDEPVYRHLMGRVFNFLVRVLAVPGIQDTQCGFKMFTREAAQLVFPLQRLDGWSFDVEVLYIALAAPPAAGRNPHRSGTTRPTAVCVRSRTPSTWCANC